MDINKFVEGIQGLFGGNELFTSALLLSMLGWIAIQLKGVPKFVWTRLRRLIFYTVTIEQTSELFDYLEAWLKHHYEKKYRNVLGYIEYSKVKVDAEEEIEVTEKPSEGMLVAPSKMRSIEDVGYRHNQDIILIKHKNIIIKVDKSREKIDNARNQDSMWHDSYTISTFFFKRRIMKFLVDVVEYNQQFKEYITKGIGIYTYQKWAEDWKRIRTLIPKSVDNIILEDKVKDVILKDIDTFIKKREWYIKRSIPYKRTHLYCGSPGNGKTSLSLALANYYNKDIYSLVLSEVVSDSTLKMLFSNVSDDAIMLIEDIDAAFSERKSEDHVSFSGLLNCLDGVFYKEGVITIMTTNHRDRLDEALVRAGRVDLEMEFNNPKHAQVKEYVERFYDIELNGAMYEGTEHPMSKIQNFCLMNSEEEIKKLLFEMEG